MLGRCWISCAALLLSCGGEAQPAKTPEPLAPGVEKTAAPVISKRPSPDVSRYWVHARQPPLTLYADLQTLTRSELLTALAPAVLDQSAEALSAGDRACVGALIEHASELVLGADQQAGLAVLALGSEGVKAARGACVGSLVPPERRQLQGADEAYGVGSSVIAVLPTVVLIGSEPLVAAALAPGATPTPLPPHFGLRAGEQVSFRVDLPEESLLASGVLGTSSERFLLAGQVQLPSDAAAAQLDEKLKERRSQAKLLIQTAASGHAAPLGRLLDALKVERRGKTFDVRFELPGAPVDQARELGTLAAMGVHSARNYVRSVRAAEAKAVLARIAKSYQVALSQPGTKLKKLVSLPAVPAAVPRGVQYQSTADDWKKWAAIQFDVNVPQAYQYEVVAAKDGKSAEVLARGDLDGDGVTSLFRLKIQLDPRTGQLTALGLDETDSFE